jgi:molybdopterin-guanine dinucleotide biosynthesis protein A
VTRKATTGRLRQLHVAGPGRHVRLPGTARTSTKAAQCEVSVAILAGGQSSRMGKDKSRLDLDGRPLLAHVRAPARELGLPVRVIRRDLVPPCGPLSGIYTALCSSKAEMELFLACDMPFVTAELLDRVIQSIRLLDVASFVSVSGVVGFPFLIRSVAAPIVLRQIERRALSLQSLAETLRARRVVVRRFERVALLNLNTPGDFVAAGAVPKRGPRRGAENSRLRPSNQKPRSGV